VTGVQTCALPIFKYIFRFCSKGEEKDNRSRSDLFFIKKY
jgi:hypothetical protein